MLVWGHPGDCICVPVREKAWDNLRWHNSGNFYLLFWDRLSLWAKEYFRLGVLAWASGLCLALPPQHWNMGMCHHTWLFCRVSGGQIQLFLLVKSCKVSTISHHIYKTETCPPWGIGGNSNIPSWGCQDLTLTITDTVKGSEPSSFSKMAESLMNRPSIHNRAGAMKFQSEEFIMWSQTLYSEK